MRQKLVAGNWKSNGKTQENQALLDGLKAAVSTSNAEVLVCPPMLYIGDVQSATSGTQIEVGAQNCSATGEGAFTGEITANMLSDKNLNWVILGHSERRSLFGETDEVVAAKVAQAVEAGVKPIICIGETLEERESGQAEAVCVKQLEAVLKDLKASESWVIAYEPVWAIGTGKTASASDAQEMHLALRSYLRETCGEVADKMRILYGGSVKASNAAELFAQADIDGALVGGASLKAEEFSGIIAAANS